MDSETAKNVTNNFIYGNMLWNAGLVGFALWCGKRLYNDIVDSISKNAKIAEETARELKESIEKLADHVATANGRTGKLEGAVLTINALCNERHKEV